MLSKAQKKAFGIASIMSIFVGTLFVLWGQFTILTSHHEKTIEFSRPLSLDPRHIAQNNSLSLEVDQYEHSSNFISEELDPGFKFTTMAVSWEEYLPGGTEIEMSARFKVDGEWSEWMDMDGELDLNQNSNPSTQNKYALATSNLASAAQYKVHMFGNGEQSPYIKNREITFLKTAQLQVDQVPEAIFSAISGSSSESDSSAYSNSGVVSRADWGANESYRYLSDNSIEPQLIELDDEFYEEFADELKVDRVVEIDANGDRYKWPLTYPEEVSKIVVHHTASSEDLDNPKQAIRDIYYYHSVSRGWGDIGYNYLIDQDGKVYQGRFGDEGVVGAHAGPGNMGSIGIALLGNYEEDPVPEDALLSLAELVGQKAKIHGIDPTAKSSFRGDLSYNVMGHQDIMSTACPGKNLSEQMATVRTLASSSAFQEKPKFVNDYDYQDQSGIYYLKIKPDSVNTVELELENIGKVDWNEDTYLILYKNDEFEDALDFPTRVETKLAMMEETKVKPGQTATFKFDIESFRKGVSTTLEIIPKVNGEVKIKEDPIKIPLTVEQPIFKYEYVTQGVEPDMLKVGSDFEGSFTLRNSGNIPWDTSNDEIVLLGKSKGIEAKATTGKLIEPGEVVTFRYSFTAPDSAQTFNEEFVPFMEDAVWSPADTKITFDTQVYERPYHADVFAKTPLTTVVAEDNVNMTIQMRNLGSETWKKDNFKLLVFKDPAIEITDLEIEPSSVKIGETARATFKLKIGESLAGSKQKLYFQPKLGNYPLIRRLIKYEVAVDEPEEDEAEEKSSSSSDSKSEDESDNSSESDDSNDQNTELNLDSSDEIRIKLSFDGNPEITSTGEFEVYSGTSLLETVSKGESVKVSRENGKFKVVTPEDTYSKNQEIRFVPTGSGILEIDNFEHRPAWNESLNDNLYRGVLEVEYYDGELVVINELPIESYLKGIGEVSNGEEVEKIKAIMVAARSYAYHYISNEEKFPGAPYNLDDDPEVSQKYLGYGLELRSPNVSDAIDDTEGEVITYDGELVKAPYFNQSDGTQTKSAFEVWGWTHTPYLIPVDDSYCAADEFLGHGVGLSGCGAKTMALQGYTYDEILKHYYTDIQISQVK